MRFKITPVRLGSGGGGGGGGGGGSFQKYGEWSRTHGMKVARCLSSGSLTPAIANYYLDWSGIGKEEDTHVRCGITQEEQVNPNVRYQLEGGAEMSKVDALETCAAKVAQKVLHVDTNREDKFHLVLVLSKNDIVLFEEALEKKGVRPADIIVNTADVREKGGREHKNAVCNWMKAVGDAPLVMLATQVSDESSCNISGLLRGFLVTHSTLPPPACRGHQPHQAASGGFFRGVQHCGRLPGGKQNL